MGFNEPVSPASYIIFKDTIGATDYYFAQNGKTGEIESYDTDASTVIQYAIDTLSNGGIIKISDANTYTISSTVNVNENIILDLGAATIVHGADITLFNLHKNARIYNGIIDTSGGSVDFTSDAILLEGESGSDPVDTGIGSKQNAGVHNTKIFGDAGVGTGTAIALKAMLADTHITYTQFNNIVIYGYEDGIVLEQDNNAWVNGNNFNNIKIDKCVHPIRMRRNGTQYIAMNRFIDMEIEARDITEYVARLEDYSNMFTGVVWDWHNAWLSDTSRYAFHVVSGSHTYIDVHLGNLYSPFGELDDNGVDTVFINRKFFSPENIKYPISNIAMYMPFRNEGVYRDWKHNIFGSEVHTPSWSTDGVIDDCIYLDDENDAINISDVSHIEFDSSESYSYGFWYKGSSYSSNRMFISQKASKFPYYVYWVNTTQEILIKLYDGTNVAEVSISDTNILSKFFDNTWHFLMVVIDRDSQYIYVYIDGYLADSASISAVGDCRVYDIPFCIGSYSPGTGMPGKYAEVMIFSKALSKEEIRLLYWYIKYNHNHLLEQPKLSNSGTAIFSGNGSKTSFSIHHGLADTPTNIRVSSASPDAEGVYSSRYDADATNIVAKFKIAPPSPTIEDSNSGNIDGTSSTISDDGKSWTDDEWIGHYVRITGGTGDGQCRRIIDNDATTLTVSPDWDTTPDSTSTYDIIDSAIEIEWEAEV